MVIKLVYTLFLALLISLFIGLGISAFYKAPQRPEYPVSIEFKVPGEQSEEEKAEMERFNIEQEEYSKALKNYSRNVSIISLVAAIIILILSLTLLNKIKMIADGILLGGVFIMAYSIIRGLMSEDSLFRFIIVAIGLVIALILGYIKFIKPKE